MMIKGGRCSAPNGESVENAAALCQVASSQVSSLSLSLSLSTYNHYHYCCRYIHCDANIIIITIIMIFFRQHYFPKELFTGPGHTETVTHIRVRMFPGINILLSHFPNHHFRSSEYDKCNHNPEFLIQMEAFRELVSWEMQKG